MTIEHDALVQRLRRAEAIVEEAGVDAGLRPAGFAEVFRALSGESTASAADGREQDQRHTSVQGELSERLSAVAAAFDVDPTVIEQVFSDDDDQLIIIAPSRRLASTSRGAMRQVAILLACARQAGGWDGSWTQPGTIRNECQRIDVYSKHFGTVLDGLDSFSGQGTGAQRQLRAHNASYKAAREVLKELGVLAYNAP